MSEIAQNEQLQTDALIGAGVRSRDIFGDVTLNGCSGVDRPGMKRLLRQAEQGDVVVVWRVDRLGRSLRDILNTVKVLEKRDVGVKSISDGIDSSTSDGRLMLDLLATLVEYDHDLIVERINSGVEVAKANGVKFGRPLADPRLIASKLAFVDDARAKGRTAAQSAKFVGWSRATFNRRQKGADSPRQSTFVDPAIDF